MTAPDPDLRVRLESHLPRSLPTGAPTAVFLFGHGFHRHAPVSQLTLLIAGRPLAPTATRMPRRDLWDWLARTGEDPEGRSYLSGFWATAVLPGLAEPGAIELAAELTVGGQRRRVRLGEVPVCGTGTDATAPVIGVPVGADTIAICLASYEPDLALFSAQLASIRAQSDADWVLRISDGGSSATTLAGMRGLIGDDPRIALEVSQRRLGPYENFERALALAPAGAGLLAACDQDDHWYPDKLASLRAALGDAAMVFSDQRLVDARGRVLRESLWPGRRREHANLASLLVANAVPGASMLMRRAVAQAALPFPPAPGVPYHDHWLALTALALGEIAYVDRPLYDYVQHRGAVMGGMLRAELPGGGVRSGPSSGSRSAYYGGYIPREIFALTLLARCGSTLTRRQRRALEWFLAAAHRPAAFTWLAARPLRRWLGRDETLGGESGLARGIAWRWLLPLVRIGAPARARAPDASFPDPPQFEQPRLRRWRNAI